MLVPIIKDITDFFQRLFYDRIKIVILYDDRIARAVEKNIDYMKSETLANSIDLKKDLENGTEIDFDKIKTKIFITKE